MVNGELVWEPPFTPEEDAAAQDRFRDMLDSGRAPGCMTDSVFLAGLSTNGSQFEGQENVGDYYKTVAKAAGVDVQGKTYLSTLAERPGDPKAWVTGRGDVQRVLEERGWSGEGAVNVKARRDRAKPQPVGIADDIVQEHVERRIAADPGLAEKPMEEVREQVRDEIKPHWAKD